MAMAMATNKAAAWTPLAANNQVAYQILVVQRTLLFVALVCLSVGRWHSLR